MSDTPFSVFFGSSTESLTFMEMVASWIEPQPNARVILWNTPEAFPAGQYTFDRLLQLTHICHAAVFIFGEDDKVWYRESERSQPRDNVLLEYGLFASRMGMKNVLICRIAKSQIASDLLGITTINFREGRTLDGKRRVMHWFSLCEQGAASMRSVEVSRPRCEHVARHLLSTEIQEKLEVLPDWSVVERPDDKALVIQHLIQRSFVFATFQDAIRFMTMAAPDIDRLNHHPEWENVWTTVAVRITTWGVGSHITDLDIELARVLDQIYLRGFGGTATALRESESAVGGASGSASLSEEKAAIVIQIGTSSDNFMSEKEVAQAVQMKRAKVQLLLAELVQAGYLSTEHVSMVGECYQVSGKGSKYLVERGLI